MAGYWFVRNAGLTGNPLYPLEVSVLGRVWLPGWFEPSAMRHSPFYIPPGELGLADAVLNVVDPRLAPLWAAGLLAAWIPRRERPESRWTGVVAALAAVNVALYWAIPYRTQQRFLLPAVGLATVPLACLLDRARWLRWTATGLLALHLVTPPIWPVVPLGRQAEWGFTGALVSAVRGPVPVMPTASQWQGIESWPDLGLVVGIPLTSGLLALLAARDWASMRRDRSPGRGLRATIAASAMLAVPCAGAGAKSWRAVRPSPPPPWPAPGIASTGWPAPEAPASPTPGRTSYTT